VLPVVFVGSVVARGVLGRLALHPAAVLIAATGSAPVSRSRTVVSVRYPMRLPETRSPFGRSRRRQGCVTGFMFLIAALVQGILLTPGCDRGRRQRRRLPSSARRRGSGVRRIRLRAVALGHCCLPNGGPGGAQPELLLAVDARRGV